MAALKFFDDDILECIEEISYISESCSKSREDCHELQKLVMSLQNEIQEARESERLQRDSLVSSKKLITEQQFTISKLISIKDDIKRCKDEAVKRETKISELQQENISLVNSHEKDMVSMKNEQRAKDEIMQQQYQNEVDKVKNEMNAAMLESGCNIRELKQTTERIKTEKEKKINEMVLDYEEQLQKSRARISRQSDELQTLNERISSNTTIYQRKIADLEYQIAQRSIQSQQITFRNDQVDRESQFKQLPFNQNLNQSPSISSKHSSASATGFSRYPLQSNAGPYKFISKPDGLVRSKLNIQITPAEPRGGFRGAPAPAAKPAKRKLFSRNTEEYMENDAFSDAD